MKNLLLDTTWKGRVARRWYDRGVRFYLFWKALFTLQMARYWNDIRYPNPATVTSSMARFKRTVA